MTPNNVTRRSEAIAESALERQIGARGLRMIIEEPLLDLMDSRPHQKKLRACVITREIVEAHDQRLSLLEKAGEDRGEPPSLY
jgi:ATP-dependent Clp protease ATP-binding subunit ClpX